MSTFLQYRTLTLARLGKADEAKEPLSKYLATDAGASFKSYVQIQVAAWLGEFEEASSLLESAVTASAQSTDDLYNVVCAAALSSQALSAKDAAQSAKFADRTIELLRQMVAQGTTMRISSKVMPTSPACMEIRGSPNCSPNWNNRRHTPPCGVPTSSLNQSCWQWFPSMTWLNK